MTCDQIRPLLSSYHDDVLSLEDRARVRMHVAICPTCGATLAAYEQVFAALREAVAPVPPDLRRNVYARIAELEARRGGVLPFGPTLLGLLRTAGGTAGLLAVLAAMVAAALRLNAGQQAPVFSAAAQHTTMTAVAADMLGSVSRARDTGAVSALPRPVQTAFAPLNQDLASGASLRVEGGSVKDSKLTIEARMVWKSTSGQPRSVTPVSVTVPFVARTPLAGSVAVGTPSPAPTLAAGDGLVYLHLYNDNAFFENRGNSDGDLEWHSFAASAPRVLATPVPSVQLFTGVNSSLDGNRIAYTAMSQMASLGGVFGFTAQSSQPVQLYALADLNRPNAGAAHQYVKQVHPASDGRWMMTIVDPLSASVAITVSSGLERIAGIGLPTFNFAITPNRRLIAWTHRALNRYGRLEIITLGAHPVTSTIAERASYPVWSPQGDRLLFASKAGPTDPAGLWMWSRQDGITRLMVAAPSGRQPFISSFAWSPDGRYFVYILTTPGRNGRSDVWLGDSETGSTWPSFSRSFIGAIAWVHAQALPPVETETSASALPPVYNATARPVDVLLSFHNAISRQDYARARSYLAASDGRTVQQLQRGYADTRADNIISLAPAPYEGLIAGHMRTCVGFQMVARHWKSPSVMYGGWYAIDGTLKNGRVADWRIAVQGSHLKANATAIIPPRSRCMAA